MRFLLLINGIIELGAGLVFLFLPAQVSKIPGLTKVGDGADVRMLLSMYGTASAVMGIYSLVLLRHTHRQSLMIGSLFLFALFHTGIALNQFIANPDVRAGIVHLVLGLVFGGVYWNRK